MNETRNKLASLNALLSQDKEVINNKEVLELLSGVISNITGLKERKYINDDVSDDENDIYKVGGNLYYKSR